MFEILEIEELAGAVCNCWQKASMRPLCRFAGKNQRASTIVPQPINAK